MLSKTISDCMIDSLLLPLQADCRSFIHEVLEKTNVEILVTAGFRTILQQNDLYQKGRTMPGNIVTNAKGGESYHNYRLAFDIATFINSVLDFKIDWLAIMEIGKSFNFCWGGTWKLKDKLHFQRTYGYSIHELQNNGIKLLQNITNDFILKSSKV